jgi:hypothetical protein
MPHDAALEAHEHAEHAEHAAHESDPFVGRVSITIAVLAVLAAAAGSLETVEAGGAITASSEAVLKQDQATDNWGFANSKAIRKNLYLIAEDQNPAKHDAYEKAEKKAEADEEKAHEKAVDFEKERDQILAKGRVHERNHHWLTIAATLLEVGIAICTVAIITKRRSFWYGSMALGSVGVALLGVIILAMAGVITLPVG